MRWAPQLTIVHIIHLTIQLSGNLVVVKGYYGCVSLYLILHTLVIMGFWGNDSGLPDNRLLGKVLIVDTGHHRELLVLSEHLHSQRVLGRVRSLKLRECRPQIADEQG